LVSLPKPTVAKLVGGFRPSWDYFVQLGKEADGYRSKQYQQYLEAMRGSLAEKEKPPVQSKGLRPIPRHLNGNPRSTELERLARTW
jgi:hypothetical protein